MRLTKTTTTTRIYLDRIGYLKPREIKEKIFIIKKTDDASQTFESVVSNK